MTKPDLRRRAADAAAPPGTAAAPQGPAELGGRGWLAAGKRTLREYKKDALPDRAAALTYYGVLSIFPALLVLVSLLGLLSKSATNTLMTNLASTLPHTVHSIIQNAVSHLQQGRGAAGAVAIVAILVGIWSASGYVAAFMRAANGVYDVQEGRPVWKTIPTRLGVTLALLILLIASTVIVVVTGGVARHVGQLLGLGSTAVTVWSIAKWPVLLLFVIIMVAILYWATPNARQRFRWVSPGAVIAVVGWLVASGLFAVYIANFSHYNRIYGSLASVIIFLIWLWITNLVILLGLEFDAELHRGRAIAAGVPAGHEPYAELRDTRKVDGGAAGQSPARGTR